MTYVSTNKYQQIIKSDIALNDGGDVYSPAFSPRGTNGNILVQVYYNDTTGTLTEAKTLTFGLGNADRNAKVDGVIIKVITGGSGGTAIAKGDLLAEFIFPPSYILSGVDYSIWVRSDSTTSGITTKEVQLQISAIY